MCTGGLPLVRERQRAWWLAALGFAAAMGGCSPAHHREAVDTVAAEIIAEKQRAALGRTEELQVASPADLLRRRLILAQGLPYRGPASLGSRDLEPVPHWPGEPTSGDEVTRGDSPVEDGPGADPLILALADCLTVAAAGSRDYQSRKEEVFLAALNLEFERDQFRGTFSALLEGEALLDRSSVGGGDSGAEVQALGAATTLGLSQHLESGLSLTAAIGYDLVRVLEPGTSFTDGFVGDASIAIPLLRGSGRHIVAEPLTRAERAAVYAIWRLERFKQEFAVDVVEGFLRVIESTDRVRNQAQNYEGLVSSTRRAQRLAEAGKLPQIQVDQSRQNELRARDRWVSAIAEFEGERDRFKLFLGLPADARIELDRGELQRLMDDSGRRLPWILGERAADSAVPTGGKVVIEPPRREEAGPFEIAEKPGLVVALARRYDLLVAEGEVEDAQRAVVVAADALGAELTLLGSAGTGRARGIGAAPGGRGFDVDRAIFDGLLTLDLPLERTAEALAYRESYVRLEAEIREVQELEDRIKLQIRDGLRGLRRARASLRVQLEASRLAERRVRGAELALEAGRAQIRDLLEAQEDLVNARNAVTSAVIDYRLGELGLQRDLGVLVVGPGGRLEEIDPAALGGAT